MRTGYYLAVLLLLLDLTVLFQPAESMSFIKISVPTAFALITAAVKIKAIILKILFGLRALGVKSFYVRRLKRFAESRQFLSQENDNELLSVWLSLQKTLGREIEFQLDPCIKSIQHKEKPINIWKNIIPKKSEFNLKATKIRKQSPDNYSSWISGIIGSITGTTEACHLLHDEFQNLIRNKLLINKTTSTS